MTFVRGPHPAECSPSIIIALRLTAIALLLRPMGDWFVRPLVLAGALVALVSPAVLVSPALWLGLSVCTAVRIAADWPLADNHIYLLAYWLLALALALSASAPARTLAASSRLLLGAAFSCAVLWKAVLAPDFIDGRFFRVTLLTDPRFGEAAMLLGGLTREQLEANRRALVPLPEGAELLDAPAIVEPPPLQSFARASTWGVLALEALVAVTMCVPGRGIVDALRHASLLVFCLVSYAFAPVAGFGWLLLVLGCARCEPPERAWRIAYVVTFVLVLFYAEIPWAGLLVDGRGQ